VAGREAAQRAQRSGALALAASAWHDLVRVGEPQGAKPLLALATGTDNPLITLRAMAVEAIAGHDPDALATAAERFEAMGLLLLAAECCAAAAGEYRRRPDARAADRLAGRAHLLAAQCDQPHTPGLTLAGPVAELTSREREIATLAAAGSSNREIADALTVSVRTVETHLQRAYTKLGVSSRNGLATVLRTRGRKAT
jgi:DNA-binding NarL/FixJ family response regulator